MGCPDIYDFYADVAGGSAGFCEPELVSSVSMWQGNSVTLHLHLFVLGSVLGDLASATTWAFQMLGHIDNAVGVYYTTGDSRVTINDPNVGIVSVKLTANETDALLGEYDLAFQASWPDKRYEWDFAKTLIVKRDAILFEQ